MSLFNISTQSSNSNVTRPKTRSDTQTLTSMAQGVGNVNVSQQSGLTSLSMASNVNSTPISSVQLSQGVNHGVIQEPDRFNSGNNNFMQPNFMQSQYRHTSATCYPTGAFTLPQKHNTVGNTTTVSSNVVDHNVYVRTQIRHNIGCSKYGRE